MAILGNTLREKREALGLSTQEVSETLEIQERFIKALEEEKLDIIPNEYYIKAFMKQYGDFLKINGDKLLANFYKEQEQLIKEQDKIEAIQKEQELVEEILVDEEPIDLNRLENLKIQQEAENLSNIDKPTEISLHISDYEYEESLKNTPNKKKFNKGIFIWPLIILLGISLAYLVHAALNLGGTKSPSVVETTTTTVQEITTVQETTTVETTTAVETTESTTETTTTTIETTQTTTVASTQEQPAASQQEYPSGNSLTYVKLSQDRATTYGLGSDYKNYTGNYNFTITVTEPTWISITIHHKVVYEGTIRTKLDFYAYNNADNVIIKTGVSNATKITMNGTELNVPTSSRVHTVEVDLKR